MIKVHPQNHTPFVHELAFESCLNIERGDKVVDTITTKVKVETSNEGFLIKTVRCICFIPKSILAVLKKMIHYLSCCMLFKEEKNIVHVELTDELGKILTLWSNSTNEIEKKAAWTALEKHFPNQKKILIDTWLDLLRTSALRKGVADPDKVKAWNERNLAIETKRVEERFDRFDATLLGSYLDHLMDEKKQKAEQAAKA